VGCSRNPDGGEFLKMEKLRGADLAQVSGREQVLGSCAGRECSERKRNQSEGGLVRGGWARKEAAGWVAVRQSMRRERAGS